MEKKKILLIATGGTIASRPGEDGLSPALTSGELLQCIPEVEELCRIDTLQDSLKHTDDGTFVVNDDCLQGMMPPFRESE